MDHAAISTKPAGMPVDLTQGLVAVFLPCEFPQPAYRRSAANPTLSLETVFAFFLSVLPGPGETVTELNAAYQSPCCSAVRK